MTLDRDPAAASRRFVLRAALLVAPLVLGAIGAPFLVRHLRAGAPAAPLLIRQLRGGAPAPAPAADEPREPPRDRPPTSEEIAEAARAQRELGRTAERTWGKAVHLAPQDARLDASGEATSRFEGFGVSVESEPAGAHVFVDGQDLGETPLVASVSCEPGARVVVRVVKPPLAPAERITTCRRDTLVALSAKLRR